jgi:hypothetical protein
MMKQRWYNYLVQATEAFFLTSVINVQERRKVITIDIPGAFMHLDIDELIT